VVRLTVAAFVLYGLWALYANHEHGWATALRAGLVQGLSSATTTLVITAGIEGVTHRRTVREGAVGEHDRVFGRHDVCSDRKPTLPSVRAATESAGNFSAQPFKHSKRMHGCVGDRPAGARANASQLSTS
jgi:hypothetical protein